MESQRLDLWLWHARLFKHRSDAQAVCQSRHLRLDGRIIEKAHAQVRPGAVISFAKQDRIIVVRVRAISDRRGSPVIAKTLYEDLSPPQKNAISLSESVSAAAANLI
jgi:ribosome-associated heat shock protein Hsp15